jgi:hypothetical protein
MAQRAFGQQGIAEFPDDLKAASARAAFIFINRHGSEPPQRTQCIRICIVNKSQKKNKRFLTGYAREQEEEE